MTIFSYVILENHLHLVTSSDDISKTMQKFKSYTAYELLKLLQKNSATTLLKQFAFHKKAHRTETTYQIWEEGFHPKLIQSEKMMMEKINYIHKNPVKRGYVDEAKYWRYSSARDYEGINGLLEVERLW
jgi:REP element-mobilizing transposase RayT